MTGSSSSNSSSSSSGWASQNLGRPLQAHVASKAMQLLPSPLDQGVVLYIVCFR
jgi:hypothetical protein